MNYVRLHGLVAATHTPFDAGGNLALHVVEKQAEHLRRDGVKAAFVGGTTGEGHSLTLDERLALADRWADVVRGSDLRLVVHVGSTCLADSRALAAHAQRAGAAAISALAPSYFKPRSLDVLIDCCRDIAAAVPATPFYFYDIPSMTGVQFPMPEFLDAAPQRIPTMVGIKFTNPDLMAYQRCLRAREGRFDIPWGTDEYLLAALALGAAGAVGSSYNFAAPLPPHDRRVLARRPRSGAGRAVPLRAAHPPAGRFRLHGRRQGDDDLPRRPRRPAPPPESRAGRGPTPAPEGRTRTPRIL